LALSLDLVWFGVARSFPSIWSLLGKFLVCFS